MAQKGLARGTVVRAALELLDETGLEGLSVRRLAARLGVQNPALYWHFRNKQELLDEMARELLAHDMGGPAEGEGWREWLTRRAHRYRRTLLSHRDGARLIATGNPGPDVARAFEQELRTLTGLGFTPAQGLHAITAISHYTLGFVLNEQAGRDRQERGDSPAPAAYARDYPLTMEGVRTGGAPTSDEAFAHGLRLILDGVAGSAPA
ncbi:TetR/AcrR family transcriptional regulator C-terminal domain-containing protein [Nonomuraea gerenzanensis]|uniref:Transcriptional regulator, TetR family n=1 Tax=Nonomuraea gerenzanensis TaxID=93944 RepID=A0A1M4EEX9_9ACTN|nr:TetR/AcrR family transcriptional regulator C-terminal domain-containing protein [Nonomuraea gerenzanensis]UBU08863.1 TetR/AcrR family transcriptional regulator C-terminal domain-containing protein [Nonomuraea gerenzanensis]SBO97228.1 Transcriptional regulator, TetR family [Nonomuraea gerenzanensis]